MKAHNLCKVFSDKVMEYMNKGYTLYPVAMNYISSEYDGHVELANKNTIIRIAVSNSVRDKLYDAVYIRVFSMPLGNYDGFSFRNRKVKLIEEIKFYEVARKKFYLSEQEYNETALHIHDKHYKRCQEHYYNRHKVYSFDLDKVRDIAYSYVSKQPRCKSIKKNDIKSVHKEIIDNTGYFVITTKTKSFTIKVRR